MSDKELLYIEDAVNHEIYMINISKNAVCNLGDENLIKTVNKIIKKHESLLSMILEIF